MARRGWNALSPGYKARLQKAGITQADYEAGQSITAARGHLHTPERPTAGNVNKFSNYVSERNRLVRRITGHKQDYFGTSPKWNPVRAARAFKDNPPSMAKLRYWADLSREEWLDAIREDPGATEFLGYH
jgi:hypothetical protein